MLNNVKVIKFLIIQDLITAITVQDQSQELLNTTLLKPHYHLKTSIF